MLPPSTIQDAILDRFTDVFGANLPGAFYIGDGARHAQDFVVGASRQSPLVDTGSQQRPRRRIQGTELSQLPPVQVGIVTLSTGVITPALDLAGSADNGTHLLAVTTGSVLCQLVKRKCRNFDLDVDAIQQGTRDPGKVAFDLGWRTLAFALWMSSKSTPAGECYI